MRREAFTLVELVLAMVITAIIGLSVAGVSLALSTSYAHTVDYYDSLQSGRTGLLRMQNVLRGSKLVTYSGPGCLMVWGTDRQDSTQGQINNEEMTILIYDSASSELRQYKIVYPASLRATLNVTQPLSAMMVEPWSGPLMSSSAYAQMTTLATDVRGFSVSLDRACPLTKCVKVTLTVGQPGHTTTFETAGRLRADSTAKVYVANGEYVLDTAGP